MRRRRQLAAREPLLGAFAVTYNLGGCVDWPSGDQLVDDGWFGGALGEVYGEKIVKVMDLALKTGIPMIGINSGRCFAGNAALLGCCDVVIATRNSTIGMAGPAMIEGGGLGVYTPEEVGPISVQATNGVVDIVADDEVHAADLARRLMGYFQGALPDWACADQRRLRQAIPEHLLHLGRRQCHFHAALQRAG